jgi:hypothetical protein
VLVDPPGGRPAGASGQCGHFPRTPGFSRIHLPVTNSRQSPARFDELIVYGRVPARAAAVVVTARRGIRREAARYPGPKGVPGDFYLVALNPRLLLRARVNWLRKDGTEGSRGIRLAPGSAPIAGSKPPG